MQNTHVVERDGGELGGPAEDPVGDDGEVLPALAQHQLPHSVRRPHQPVARQAHS